MYDAKALMFLHGFMSHGELDLLRITGSNAFIVMEAVLIYAAWT
jgi:hypothetical protein